MKGSFLIYLIFIIISIFITSCSEKSSIVEPKNSISSLSKDTSALTDSSMNSIFNVDDGYWYKINPPADYIQNSTIYFSWGPSKTEYYDVWNRRYTFSTIGIIIDDYWHVSLPSLIKYSSDAGSYLWDCYLPIDGEMHTWQVVAYYSYSGGVQPVEFDLGAEWNFRLGLQTPQITGTWENGHPKLSWSSIPGADGYWIEENTPGSNFWSYVTSTTFSDTRYNGPGSGSTISYYIYACAEGWPIYPGVGSEQSNIVDFQIQAQHIEHKAD